MAKAKKSLSAAQRDELLQTLKNRFGKNMKRHAGIEWGSVEKRLASQGDKLWTLHEMERTGGEPDVVEFDKGSGEYIFYDCSPETPKERRSLCYDRKALDARKEAKPANSALDMADEIGVEMLTEEQYRALQQFGPFDTKTSSWLKTPPEIRKLDGSIFGDYRYGTVFIYHNGASSYYASRSFRGAVRV